MILKVQRWKKNIKGIEYIYIDLYSVDQKAKKVYAIWNNKTKRKDLMKTSEKELCQ